MFLTNHACSFCGRESAWCLAAGPGDQLLTDRPEAAWICAWCINEAFMPVDPQPRGTRCHTCWRTIGRREVIIHSDRGPHLVPQLTHVEVVRAKAMLVRGSRVLCHYCLDEARRITASPWVRVARTRWPKVAILGDGPFAVLGCDGQRIQLWVDRGVAERASTGVELGMCGPQCRGNHCIEELPYGS